MSEKVTIKVERQTLHLPAIALRGLVVFPNNLVHFEVGREKSVAAIEWAMNNNSNVFLVAQKRMDTDEPVREDLFTYGVVAEVKQVLRVSEDLVRVLVEGKYRARMTDLDCDGKFLLAAVQAAPVRSPKEEESVQTDALVRSLKAAFDEYMSLNQQLAKEVVFAIVSSDDPVFLSEYIPANLLLRYEDKQAVMDENTLNGRLEKLLALLQRECQVMQIEKEISDKVNESMDKNQRDYYLHEQLNIISSELGEGDDTHAEAEDYRRRILELHLAEESEAKLLKEVDRLAKMQGSNQEATVIRTYLDTCLDLPWNTFTEDDLDIAKAQQILDEATIDSNNIRLSAIAYTDDMLANLEQIMSGALNDAGEKYKSYISAVQSCYDVVTQNRNELAPQVAAAHTTDSVEDLDVSADDDEE